MRGGGQIAKNVEGGEREHSQRVWLSDSLAPLACCMTGIH